MSSSPFVEPWGAPWVWTVGPGLRPGELLQLLLCSAVTSSLHEQEKSPREVPETTESGWRGLPVCAPQVTLS